MTHDAPPVDRPRSAASAGRVTATAALPIPARPNSSPTSAATRPASEGGPTRGVQPPSGDRCSDAGPGSAPGPLLVGLLGQPRLGLGQRLRPAGGDLLGLLRRHELR